MSTKIDGVKVFYTENGNPVAKSNSGKRTGTLLGVLGYVGTELAAMKFLNNRYFKGLSSDIWVKANPNAPKNIIQYLKQYFRGDMTAAFRDALSKTSNPIKKFVYKASLTKGGRIGLMAGAVATGLTTCALIGRGIGAIVDKIKDKKHAKEVDAIAKENLEAQK